MKSNEEGEEEIRRTVELADAYLSAWKDTLVMTSRQLITGKSGFKSLLFSLLWFYRS